ncbi:Fic family protein [Adlercreutzia sp. ZJ473]|uniref:Fic family protein n=1 Tax=Adlercreutzia sp. ZJ473 TaxID=2722822 RepID=UPI0035302633
MKPTQLTDPVPTQLTDPVARLCVVLTGGPLSISKAMGLLGLSQKRNFRERHLNPALELNCIERTMHVRLRLPFERARHILLRET